MLPTATDPRQQLADFAHYLREHGFALGFAEIDLMLRAVSALPCLASVTCRRTGASTGSGCR